MFSTSSSSGCDSAHKSWINFASAWWRPQSLTPFHASSHGFQFLSLFVFCSVQVILNVALQEQTRCSMNGEKALMIACFTPNGPATYLLKVIYLRGSRVRNGRRFAKLVCNNEKIYVIMYVTKSVWIICPLVGYQGTSYCEQVKFPYTYFFVTR